MKRQESACLDGFSSKDLEHTSHKFSRINSKKVAGDGDSQNEVTLKSLKTEKESKISK